MNFIETAESDELRRHLVDPRDLTQAERNALERVATHFLRRRYGGWGIRGERKVTSKDIIDRLIRRGLVRVANGGRGGPTLDTTSLGRETMALITRRRKAAAR